MEIPIYVEIPRSELTFSYARSSGPGGQNVNKVNSKVILRWSLTLSSCLSEVAREHLGRRLSHQLTLENEIVISSDRFRDQGRNREDCIEKFYQKIQEALKVQKPRKKTKPTRSSQRRKREFKNKLSEKKTHRKKIL